MCRSPEFRLPSSTLAKSTWKSWNRSSPATKLLGYGSPLDFDFPQREAAFFYGLFLRGHSAEELRRDIEVPPAVLLKWHRESERDPSLRDVFTRMVDFRRHVLAIFEALVDTESRPQRIQ